MAEVSAGEARFPTVVKGGEDVAWSRDACSGCFTYLAPAFERIWGEPCAVVQANPERWAELIHPEDRAIAATLLSLAQRGEPAEVEYRIVRPVDGAERRIRDRAFPVFQPDGRIGQVAGLAHDITGERRAGEDPAKGETRLRGLTELIPQLVWSALPGGAFDWSGRQWQAYTGLSARQSRGLGWLATIHPEDRPATLWAWADAAPTGKFDVAHRIRGHDGSYRWFRSSAAARWRSTGLVERWFGTSTDIDDLRRVEAALRESEARFRHMADSAPALIWMTDGEGQVTFANLHFDYLFGRPGAAMLDDGWKAVVVPEDLKQYFTATRKTCLKRRPFKLDIRVRDRDERIRWLRTEGVPRLDDMGGFLGYTGCSVDVTDAKDAERRQTLLIGELNHRVKNILAAVQSLAAQTARNARSVANFLADFQPRLRALARAHDLLTREAWTGTTLEAVASEVLAPYLVAGERVMLRGPVLHLAPRAAVSLAMALQELATNALKYGALSTPQGQVDITWCCGADGYASLNWVETGGPPVVPPTRQGFGARLLERGLRQDLQAEVRLDYEATGLRCVIRFVAAGAAN